MIHANRDKLTVEVLITGSDTEAARIAQKIEPIAIEDDNPAWNKQHKPKG